MNMQLLVILCLGIGVVLLVLELMIPSHGVLGILSAVAILIAIGSCYAIDPWLGLGALVATAMATPFGWMAFVKLWPRTPVGRRMVLSGPSTAPLAGAGAAPIAAGERGVSVSELRPMGLCEFVSAPGEKIEAISEHGIVPAGRAVLVVNVVNQRPTVREIG